MVTSLAQGQSGASGTIRGTISDSQNLSLPGATVEVLDSQGTTVKKVVGRYYGSYRVADIPIGTYTLQFSRDGFRSVRKDAVVVAAGQTVTVDAALPPQALSPTVTVTAHVDDQNVASKTDIPASDLPVTVNTVSRDLIQEQNLTASSPPSTIFPLECRTQYGSLNYFEFRGLVMDQDPGSAILLNGIPSRGTARIPRSTVSRKWTSSRAGSMLYGTQDPGGTINIVEKNDWTPGSRNCSSGRGVGHRRIRVRVNGTAGNIARPAIGLTSVLRIATASEGRATTASTWCQSCSGG